MTVPHSSVSQNADREIVLTRILQAPRELVWKVWTDPQHIALWWGPNGFTNTIHAMDVRPGGVWRFMMHGPDGVDYPNKIVYTEVVKPERLVYFHGDDGETAEPDFHVTVTFAEHEGQTKLTMQTLFTTAEQREMVVREYGAIEGGQQTINRLEEYLSNMP
jgi:uncharacterized protein YndB with AHSA1/START domain